MKSLNMGSHGTSCDIDVLKNDMAFTGLRPHDLAGSSLSERYGTSSPYHMIPESLLWLPVGRKVAGRFLLGTNGTIGLQVLPPAWAGLQNPVTVPLPRTQPPQVGIPFKAGNVWLTVDGNVGWFTAQRVFSEIGDPRGPRPTPQQGGGTPTTRSAFKIKPNVPAPTRRPLDVSSSGGRPTTSTSSGAVRPYKKPPIVGKVPRPQPPRYPQGWLGGDEQWMPKPKPNPSDKEPRPVRQPLPQDVSYVDGSDQGGGGESFPSYVPQTVSSPETAARQPSIRGIQNWGFLTGPRRAVPDVRLYQLYAYSSAYVKRVLARQWPELAR